MSVSPTPGLHRRPCKNNPFPRFRQRGASKTSPLACTSLLTPRLATPHDVIRRNVVCPKCKTSFLKQLHTVLRKNDANKQTKMFKTWTNNIISWRMSWCLFFILWCWWCLSVFVVPWPEQGQRRRVHPFHSLPARWTNRRSKGAWTRRGGRTTWFRCCFWDRITWTDKTGVFTRWALREPTQTSDRVLGCT